VVKLDNKWDFYIEEISNYLILNSKRNSASFNKSEKNTGLNILLKKNVFDGKSISFLLLLSLI